MAKPSILVVLYPGCIFFELALALELVSEKFEVVFATPDGTEHLASNGATIRADASYENVDLDDCKAILIPGGDPGSIKDNAAIDRVLRDADERGLWMAAICAGPLVLAKAGVLNGRQIAHGYGAEQLEFLKSYFEGVQLTDDQFVCDGNVITAKPDMHIDFAVELACRLGAADASKANRLKDYYRGILGHKIRPLALAWIRNASDQFLFHKGTDTVKGETFYRPLGGGIEFGESGERALAREIMEELGQEIKVAPLVASFENIFTYEGRPGHEIVMLFPASFIDTHAYKKAELDIVESGQVVGKAVWRSIAEINREGSKIYPNGLETVMKDECQGFATKTRLATGMPL